MNEKNYAKGFNQGYLLQQHKPELSDKIKSTLKDSKNDRDIGFVDGAKEFTMEKLNKLLSKKPNYSHKNIQDKQPGLDMTKDGKDRTPDMDREW